MTFLLCMAVLGGGVWLFRPRFMPIPSKWLTVTVLNCEPNNECIVSYNNIRIRKETIIEFVPKYGTMKVRSIKHLIFWRGNEIEYCSLQTTNVDTINVEMTCEDVQKELD